MKKNSVDICVYFDGSCPSCVRDRDNYLRLAGKSGEDVKWLDITDKDEELLALGIKPEKALKELHIKIDAGNQAPQILSELDAYIELMKRTVLLKPLAWFVALPIIRPLLSKLYHLLVMRRLKSTNRW